MNARTLQTITIVSVSLLLLLCQVHPLHAARNEQQQDAPTKQKRGQMTMMMSTTSRPAPNDPYWRKRSNQKRNRGMKATIKNHLNRWNRSYNGMIWRPPKQATPETQQPSAQQTVSKQQQQDSSPAAQRLAMQLLTTSLATSQKLKNALQNQALRDAAELAAFIVVAFNTDEETLTKVSDKTEQGRYLS